MATGTGGSNANNSLTSLLISDTMLPADIATICNGILDDKINTYPNSPIYPGAFAQNRHLYIPNRGYIRCIPGDYVMIDPTGWPILVSANAILHGPWTS
jgi:hypothetical protein